MAYEKTPEISPGFFAFNYSLLTTHYSLGICDKISFALALI